MYSVDMATPARTNCSQDSYKKKFQIIAQIKKKRIISPSAKSKLLLSACTADQVSLNEEGRRLQDVGS